MPKDEGRIYELMWKFYVFPDVPLKTVNVNLDIGELEECKSVSFKESIRIMWTIRVWARVQDIADPMDLQKEFIKTSAVGFVMSCMTPIQLANALADTFPDVINAVEVLDADGNGGLAYNDWP